ncbi:MAG: LysR family transcriptional regulator [Gemmatimonadetes bacterium]|nr:LysR family transcriptional regulator [Gemmatimonadota bacterium]
MDHLDLDLLRTFAVIAETGALSRAAVRVGRTQAAISLQVKRLEQIVSQTLLDRSGRGVTLTPQGTRLLAHAQRILRYHDEALAELSGKGLTGTIRFGCPDDYAVVLLPQLLRGFAREHPEVLVEVYCGHTPRLLERLERHALDLALTSFGEQEKNAAIIRWEPLVWVGSVGSNAANLDPLRLALSDPDTLDHRAARRSLEAVGRSYRLAYASASLAGLTAVVRSGQAIAVLTRTAVPEDLRILPPETGLPPLPQVGIALTVDSPEPAAVVSAFAEYVRMALPTL